MKSEGERGGEPLQRTADLNAPPLPSCLPAGRRRHSRARQSAASRRLPGIAASRGPLCPRCPRDPVPQLGLQKPLHRDFPWYISAPPPAGWRRGYAADCKSVKTGSIPVPASILLTSYCFMLAACAQAGLTRVTSGMRCVAHCGQTLRPHGSPAPPPDARPLCVARFCHPSGFSRRLIALTRTPDASAIRNNGTSHD